MQRNNFIPGLIFGALVMFIGMTIGFYAGYHKHEADSMRVLNQWIEKEIQKREGAK